MRRRRHEVEEVKEADGGECEMWLMRKSTLRNAVDGMQVGGGMKMMEYGDMRWRMRWWWWWRVNVRYG